MPASPDVLLAQAAAHYRGGAFEEAARCGLDIVVQAPDHFDALHLLGVLCLNRGQAADAVCYLTRAICLQPDNLQMGLNFGNALLALKIFSRAEKNARRLVASYPNSADALCNLASALLEQHREQEALDILRTALVHEPDHVPAHFFTAKSQEALGLLEEAAASFQAALASAPSDMPSERLVDLLTGWGGVLVALDRPEDALTLFADEQARRFEPLDLTWNTSLLHLQLGDYPAGWRGYESRWQVKDHDKPRADSAVLDIAAIEGKRILVTCEQGRGDVIQFARYAPLLAEHGATVCLSVYDNLRSLLSRIPGVSRVIGEDDFEPPYDFVTSLLSLPLAFKTDVDTIPTRMPYLSADPDLVAAWLARLGERTGPRVGLAWWGAQHIPSRSMRFPTLTPLLEQAEISFHSLQQDLPDRERILLLEDGRIEDHAAEVGDFAKTAALVETMDIIVTVDTSFAHLAGAMGKPVWIMLPYVADWRWLRHRDDSPWYPTARLFRQTSRGDWDEVVARVAAALDQLR